MKCISALSFNGRVLNNNILDFYICISINLEEEVYAYACNNYAYVSFKSDKDDYNLLKYWITAYNIFIKYLNNLSIIEKVKIINRGFNVKISDSECKNLFNKLNIPKYIVFIVKKFENES